MLLILLSLLGAGLFGAQRLLNLLFFANPDYAIHSVEVTSDGDLGRDVVLRAAQIEDGSNIFSINLSAVEDRLRALPQVEEVNVQRLLPDKLVIVIQERRPIAWIASADANRTGFNYDGAFLVDRRGIVLQPKGSAPEYMTLPVIIGVDLKKVTVGEPVDSDPVKATLELIRECPEMLQSRFQIATIDVSKEYSLVVTDKQRSLVTFSPDDLTDQLRRLAMLLSYCEKNSKELQSANLMAERNIPVVFNEPAVAVASSSPQPAAQPTASPQPQAQPIVRRALPVTRPAHKSEKADKSPSPNKNTHKKTKSSELKPFNG
ncbi:MAG TPA: FtsQ-type POTRA domain-containing protein [Chthoniobacterales bacterium]|nr:FtsQ-type POTRA domain-containing protein [Chthoniobacterales bacterium]